MYQNHKQRGPENTRCLKYVVIDWNTECALNNCIAKTNKLLKFRERNATYSAHRTTATKRTVRKCITF